MEGQAPPGGRAHMEKPLGLLGPEGRRERPGFRLRRDLAAVTVL